MQYSNENDKYVILKYVTLKNVVGNSQKINISPNDYPNTDTVSYTYGSTEYANGKFFMLPYMKTTLHETSDESYFTYATSTAGAYSLDGIIWKSITFPSFCDGYVRYGNEVYVAVGEYDIKLSTIDHTNDDFSWYPTSKAAYSVNGISWTSVSMPAAQEWTGVCYGNGLFVAVGDANTTVYKEDNTGWDDAMCVAISYTGKSWTKVTKSNIVLSFRHLCYGNGKFVASNDEDNKIYYSNDGTEWHSLPSPISTKSVNNLIFGNDLFVIGTSNYIYYSRNLYDWDSTYTGSEYICYGNGKFITSGKYSYDCKTWNDYPYSGTGVYGNDRWVSYSVTWTDRIEYNHTLIGEGEIPTYG